MPENTNSESSTVESAAPKPMKQWISSCHCNANRFTVSLPDHFQVSDCNCSLCQKEGAMWCMVGLKSADVEWTKGAEHDLSSYVPSCKPDGEYLNLLFCPTCGTLMYARRESPGKDVVAIGLNARALRGIDIWSLKKRRNEGKSEGAPYMPKKPIDIDFASVEDGLTVYDGSCHCGTITFKVKTKPLEEHTALDCNCSICVRNGYLWIYPLPEAVLVSPSSMEHLTGYSLFAGGAHSHRFCKKCGTSLLNFIDQSIQRPVNVRCIDGVDCFQIKTKKYDGWGTREPQYSPE